MVKSNQERNQHLLWRAGFGPNTAQLDSLDHISQKSLLKSLMPDPSSNPVPFDVADPSLRNLLTPREGMTASRRDLSDEDKKTMRKTSVADIKKLNLRWLDEMTLSDAQLREKMALFWHGHFATRTQNIFYDQALLQVIREHALGNFGDLLRNVSKSAAMINFLNANQNRKDHPNENFGRELMELFTLGRGNYSEQDVKESARAFTGWGANFTGSFVFRRNLHDGGEKTILGSTGAFDGDDVLDLLLKQKQTARFITTKIYRYFVNDQADADKITGLSARFYASGYDIRQLMEDIFTAPWFYGPENTGNRIKSPVELLVGLRRMLPIEFENPEVQLLIQRILGQVLFNPPNVAGWPGGTHWIDSSSLMFRLRMPQVIYESDMISVIPKDDDDTMMGMHAQPALNRSLQSLRKNGQIIRASIHWDAYTAHFTRLSDDQLLRAIAQVILPTGREPTEVIMKKYTDSSSRDALLRSITIRLMSTPEYQLC